MLNRPLLNSFIADEERITVLLSKPCAVSQLTAFTPQELEALPFDLLYLIGLELQKKPKWEKTAFLNKLPIAKQLTDKVKRWFGSPSFRREDLKKFELILEVLIANQNIFTNERELIRKLAGFCNDLNDYFRLIKLITPSLLNVTIFNNGTPKTCSALLNKPIVWGEPLVQDERQFDLTGVLVNRLSEIKKQYQNQPQTLALIVQSILSTKIEKKNRATMFYRDIFKDLNFAKSFADFVKSHDYFFEIMEQEKNILNEFLATSLNQSEFFHLLSRAPRPYRFFSQLIRIMQSSQSVSLLSSQSGSYAEIDKRSFGQFIECWFKLPFELRFGMLKAFYKTSEVTSFDLLFKIFKARGLLDANLHNLIVSEYILEQMGVALLPIPQTHQPSVDLIAPMSSSVSTQESSHVLLEESIDSISHPDTVLAKQSPEQNTTTLTASAESQREIPDEISSSADDFSEQYSLNGLFGTSQESTSSTLDQSDEYFWNILFEDDSPEESPISSTTSQSSDISKKRKQDDSDLALRKRLCIDDDLLFNNDAPDSPSFTL